MTLMLINSPENPKSLAVSETINLVPALEASAPVISLESYAELGRVSLLDSNFKLTNTLESSMSASDVRELNASMFRHPAGSAFRRKKLMLQ